MGSAISVYEALNKAFGWAKGTPLSERRGIRRRLQVDCTAGMAASAIIFESHLAAHPASLGEAATLKLWPAGRGLLLRPPSVLCNG
jgi:hypothetical protein